MADPAEPHFPLRAVHLDNGIIEPLKDLRSAGAYLEFHSSDDPDDAVDMLILDSQNRPVRIVVDMFQVTVFELYDAEPLSEEEILLLVRRHT